MYAGIIVHYGLVALGNNKTNKEKGNISPFGFFIISYGVQETKIGLQKAYGPGQANTIIAHIKSG